MDIYSREYVFASELVTNVMQLYSSTWEPDIKPLYEKDSPFTSSVEEAIYFIWNEKKEFINDLFSTVLKLGTINVTNYEVPVKFASHLVTEAEYDEIELLRYCVIAAGYATLFFQNGLKDVPDLCLHFIYNAITTFKSKNEFDDESWFDIELLGQAYCKSFSEDIYSDESVISTRSRKSEDPSSKFQIDVSDQNAVKTKNNVPCAIKKPLKTCITSKNFSCRATTSKECGTIRPRTKNLKRKRPRKKRAVKKNLGNLDLSKNTTDTKVFPGEVAETKSIPKKLLVTTKYKEACPRKVTYRSKKVANAKHKFPKSNGTKDSSVKEADTKNFTLSQSVSKTTAVSGTGAKCDTMKAKSSKDATENIEVIDLNDVTEIGDCDNVKKTEYTIKKLNWRKLRISKVTSTKCKSKKVDCRKLRSQKVAVDITPTEKNADDKYTSDNINKVTSTKCKSKKVKSRKLRSQKVAVDITSTEKNADNKYTSEKIKDNKDTFMKISNQATQEVSMESIGKLRTDNKIAHLAVSRIKDIELKVQAISPKSNKSKTHNKTNIFKGNKYLATEVADNKVVDEQFMLSKYVSKKAGKVNDYAKKVEKIYTQYKNVEPIRDNINKVKQINHTSAVEKIYGFNTNVKIAENTKKVSESKLAPEERKCKSEKDKTNKIETKKSLNFIVCTLKNTLEKEVTIQPINENQEDTTALIEEITAIKSRKNKSTNVIAKSQETIYTAEGLVKTKCKNKTIKGSTDAFSENATNNYGDKEVNAEITNENVAETEYGNKSKKCEEPRYEEVHGEVEETRYASKTCTESNTLKSINKVKKIKVLKYKNKGVGFKGMLGKSTKRDTLNKNLKRKKLPPKKPTFTNPIINGKYVFKFAELETACVNSPVVQFSNENVQCPFTSNDKEIIEKHAKMRSPLSKISTNYATELEGHDSQINNKE